jgi:EAL domain-containing protein (putative c-di-GMP-specific phosphodiesterase class I)/PAS domain-containing protein
MQGEPLRAYVERSRHVLLSMAVLMTVVLCVLPVAGIALDGRPSMVSATLAVVCSLDVLSAVLLVRHFRETGSQRALILASAFIYSLVVIAGFGAAFRGVLADGTELGRWPTTSPCLWVAWHTGFPILLAAAVGPWPARWMSPSPAPVRRRLAWIMVVATAGGAVLIVAGAAVGRSWLPSAIDGMNTSELARYTAPVMVPLVAAATVAAVVGALRLRGPLRWTALAATAAFGDVAIALVSHATYSLGWYAGRLMSGIACAVVAVAMLAELGRLKGLLAVEADRLRAVLQRTEELELLHSTLLNHMTDGVILQGADGHLVALNPAAEMLLGQDAEQLGSTPEPDWQFLRPDGTPWPFAQTPPMVTLATGEAQRDAMVGVHLPGGSRRWLRVNTSAERATPDGPIRFVMSSMTDETRRHDDYLAGRLERDDKRARVEAVISAGGPQIVVQPIVDLRSGAVIGGEALSRFAGPLIQGPDRWFADAADIGLGAELEMLAVRGALDEMALMPSGTYLSVNVSASTALCTDLLDLLGGPDVDAGRVVVELTEHSDVDDYPLLHLALARLRSFGVKVAVDDTGAGFASLSHLLALRPDIVKLDLDLVRGIHLDPARRALATGLLAFAEQIGAYLVAEGIETEHELAALRSIGVTHGQGYYLGRPAPLPWPDVWPAYGQLATSGTVRPTPRGRP